MRRLILMIAVAFPLVAPAESTRIKVKKVKGQMALVEVQGTVNPGDNFTLVAARKGAEGPSGGRERRLGLTFNFATIKTKATDTESTSTQFSILADYGWVMGHHEVGPVFGYSFLNPGFGGSSNALTLGLFYDYNFDENKETETYLLGAGARITYVNTTPASGDTTLPSLSLYPNLFCKWWAFGQSTALRIDAGLYVDKSRVSATTETESTGFKSTASLLFYF